MDAILLQLKSAIQARGWSQSELAERSGLRFSQATISRKLAGQTPMTLFEMEAIANTLQITLAYVGVRKRKIA